MKRAVAQINIWIIFQLNQLAGYQKNNPPPNFVTIKQNFPFLIFRFTPDEFNKPCVALIS